ncbi:hypothetical protein THASP1DRAFT_28940 [Thamnocephalis sphaerospora]|uniref:Peptidase M20 dimerisation domain-containing protein n=1 Tax=Thamnocephalis sphaerospora TaxID=78915 RepID=A0A4P9XTE5_9FUNG|nr:hypothetical protein THASP1DRAFT_28940 [Thamnocephalis sphaerospora]|eukprot:RKP09262.1 hypothetical protein THASP1DRAFT_28940 [Thamnocephalis sphaerospora]
MTVDKFFEHVDKQQDDYVQRLREIVAIPSVSCDLAYRKDVVRMGEWLINELEKLGATTKRVEPGTQVLEGQTIDLPPVVLGTYGTDPNKKTLLVYGHYDVQPALKEDGWRTDPWQLTEDQQGRMFGRGSTDDKGPVLGWLCVIQAHKDLGLELPVNLKFCFEGMEESGSEGLDDVIHQEANAYFQGVDAVCISDNYWLGKTKPCLTYGLRGVSYYRITIAGPGQDLHSGVFGGTVHEPMTDLVNVMARLVTPEGKILVPGIMDEVAPLTDEERATYQGLEFSMKEFCAAAGSECNVHEDVEATLMHRWRYPSLSLHGIEGAFHAPGAKTVIPAKVIGKFSIRTVPNQTPARVTELVKEHVKAEFAKLNSRNTLDVDCLHDGKWWISSPNHPNFVAGARAVERVFGAKPDLTREGGSIPVTLTFQDALQKNVLLLPMGACDDGAHSINEKLDRRNFVEGIKLLGAYLHELSAIEL